MLYRFAKLAYLIANNVRSVITEHLDERNTHRATA